MTDVFTFSLGEPQDNSEIEIGTPAQAPDESLADEATLLAKLKSTLAKKVERPTILLEVPERPNMLVRYSPNITQHQVRSWRKNSGAESKAGLDSVRFSCHVLANTCAGILIDGQLVTDSNATITFNHRLIQEMLGVTTAFEAVRTLYGIDPHVEAAAIAVLDAAGFNDSVEQVDPTKNS